MIVLYNGWEDWIMTKGKEFKVGDGSKKTFHYVMGSWYNENIRSGIMPHTTIVCT
jgi:hypothetical protein